ncbi:MAG: Fic family protein [Rhodobacteraceae bacterium]|nr:Fic family protein [Paracoccaceae bacterium]
MRIAHIHPFINGNDRTARAACLYVLCVDSGQRPPTKAILPDLIKQSHDECIDLLQHADKAWLEGPNSTFDASLTEIAKYLHRLVNGPGGGAQNPDPSA